MRSSVRKFLENVREHVRILEMKKRNLSLMIFPFIILLITGISCRPIITVGWQEIGILAVLLLVLVGPAVYRLFRRFEEFQNWKIKRGKNDPEC